MQIVKSLKEIKEKFVLTVGNFDGVHKGHQNMLKQIKSNGLPLAVLTFVPHPVQVLFPQNNFLLNDYIRRRDLLEKVGVDYLFEVDFNRDLSTKEPDAFLDEYIMTNELLQEFFVGHDFAFGSEKKGDYEYILNYCSKKNLKLTQLDQFVEDTHKISSSYVRKLISQGDVNLASKMLGGYFRLKGIIVKGEGRGKRIGVPTANMSINSTIKKPAPGVYITNTYLNGQKWHSVTNIGNNPTFNNSDELFIETHILDFDNDIYGEDLIVEFVERIRDEKKFDDVNTLVAQIKSDIKCAQEFFDEQKA
jgi:riboflavin kinase/FMN adenylyltransferase